MSDLHSAVIWVDSNERKYMIKIKILSTNGIFLFFLIFFSSEAMKRTAASLQKEVIKGKLRLNFN